MRHHEKEPTHRVEWEILKSTCEIQFTGRRQAEKMRDWLRGLGRVAKVVAL